MNEFQIRTCADALTHDLIEHTRCERHGHGEHLAATKPLRLDPVWDGRSP